MDTKEKAEFLKEKKLILVLRGVPKEKLLSVARAAFLGGVRVMEVALDLKSEENTQTALEEIALLKKEFGERCLIGAGTVGTKEQVQSAKKAGAELIVSPFIDEEVATETKRQGLLSIVGAFTATEIHRAVKLGADGVKLFPSSALSLSAIKDLLVPFPCVPVFLFGGVKAETMQDALKIGVSGFGVQSGIVAQKAVDEEDYEKITALAKEYTARL